MGSVTYKADDPEAQPFEAERRRNEEQTRAHREKRDKPVPDRTDAPASTGVETAKE